LTKRFRRRFKKSANQKQELSVAAMWAFAITWRPSSVNVSHFNLLLWNLSAKWTEIWLEASMEVLSKDCSFCPKKNKQIKMFWNGFQHFYQVKKV
jgi:hypothetical protein